MACLKKMDACVFPRLSYFLLPASRPSHLTLLALCLVTINKQVVPKLFSPLRHRANEEDEEEGGVCGRRAGAGTDVGIWLMEHPA